MASGHRVNQRPIVTEKPGFLTYQSELLHVQDKLNNSHPPALPPHPVGEKVQRVGKWEDLDFFKLKSKVNLVVELGAVREEEVL